MDRCLLLFIFIATKAIKRRKCRNLENMLLFFIIRLIKLEVYNKLLIYFQSGDTFIPIASTLMELYDNEVDVYWLCKSLTEIVRNMQKDLPKLKEAFQSMLEKEDVELFKYVNVYFLIIVHFLL